MDRKGHHRGNLPPAAPARKPLQIIRTHQPDEPGRGENSPQRAQRVDGIASAESRLDIGGNDPSPIGDMSRAGKPISKRCHSVCGLEGIAGRDHQPDLIQPQPTAQLSRNMQMSGMRRVERPAKDTDALPTPVTTRGDRSRQGRHPGASIREICSATNLPIPGDHIAINCQLLEAHRSASVDPASGNPDFGAETKLRTVTELGRGVPQRHRTINP